jgi:uncharacterized protein YoxC
MFGSMNTTQILLSIMILLLGVTLVIVGIQLFFVLKDVRRNLEKTHKILGDVEQITAKAVVEQVYLDDILVGLKGMVGSMSSATSSVTSVTKMFSPGGAGTAMFSVVNRMLQKRSAKEGFNGRTSN